MSFVRVLSGRVSWSDGIRKFVWVCNLYCLQLVMLFWRMVVWKIIENGYFCDLMLAL